MSNVGPQGIGGDKKYETRYATHITVGLVLLFLARSSKCCRFLLLCIKQLLRLGQANWEALTICMSFLAQPPASDG
jgi:hypothetical protein